ncbi:MAG: hypothetical protein Q4P06_05770 [Actinomycetaceae bacterium]|nr:hypothetical protein [Actinomycetaceae bacterium]
MSHTPDNPEYDEFYADGEDEAYMPAPQAPVEDVYGPSTVIAALDQIDDLVEAARALPMSASVLINKAEILDLLDQAREALPQDLVAADAVVADADALIGRADDVAENTMNEANARAEALLEDARSQAEQMTSRAREEAEARRDQAGEEAAQIVAQARQEAEETVEAARLEAQRLISQEEVTVRAKEEARRIVTEAENDAIELADGADQYCMDSLQTLQKSLERIAHQTKAGYDSIAQRKSQRYGTD